MPIKQKGAKQQYLTIQEDRLLAPAIIGARTPPGPTPLCAPTTLCDPTPRGPTPPSASTPHAIARLALARPTLLR
ncbi:hypothetical protein V502_05159 [Pseudogymnoascus sp. VKM F-4520 (FW-2644)]|nr:hypothetical protein V502_05159 [Pseudogymnoascus sp. VKM F-4520 (FW-2644)]